MSENRPDDDREPDYEVGYRRPPKEHRFKKGDVGNPNGRPPKKRKTVGERFRDVLEQEVPVKEGDKTRQVTVLEAIILAQRSKALRGDLRAARFLIELNERYQDNDAQTLDWSELEEADRRIIEDHLNVHAESSDWNEAKDATSSSKEQGR